MRAPDRLEPWAVRMLMAVALLVCALAPWARPGAAPTPTPTREGAPEWPTVWEGRALRPLALSAVEMRFAERFPGHIARLSDGEQVVVMREVHTPTRMLHPAADCYRGLGYAIAEARLERDAQAQLWRCFVATRDGQRLRVCERIVHAQGEAYTDASSWFWAAALGHSTGPWRAITTARAL